MIVEAQFWAAEEVGAIYAFAAACIPGAGKFHLFTVPPKAVLKDRGAMLYSAGANCTGSFAGE